MYWRTLLDRNSMAFSYKVKILAKTQAIFSTISDWFLSKNSNSANDLPIWVLTVADLSSLVLIISSRILNKWSGIYDK